MKRRPYSPFRKPTAVDTKRIRAFTMPESMVCPCEEVRPASIYFAFKGERVAYVGQSVDFVARRKSHGARDWDEVRILPLRGQRDLDRVECAFIALFRPCDNRAPGAQFDEAEAEKLLRDFGFLPSVLPVRPKKGTARPRPTAADTRMIWHYLDAQQRRLLLSLARDGRKHVRDRAVAKCLTTIDLRSYWRARTAPPHRSGRRGRERFAWMDKKLVPVILRLAAQRDSSATRRDDARRKQEQGQPMSFRDAPHAAVALPSLPMQPRLA
jgi:hypothetical protein